MDRDYGWSYDTLHPQDEELRSAGMAAGGVLTPASAMGAVLLARLQQNAGTSFVVHESK